MPRARPGRVVSTLRLSPGHPIAGDPLEAFLVSTAAVAIAEIGDKTQLLALVLAARYRRVWPIALGIALATVLNHALAGWLGSLVAGWIPSQWHPWLIAASFLAVALWALVPDTLDADETPKPSRYGPFLATTVAFFLIEMGDKTQIATVVLGAEYSPLWAVVAGSTLGMMRANVPVLLVGAKYAERVPMHYARWAAAALFLLLAAAAVWSALA